MPLFSVIIPVYNRESLLPATIQSVLCQRFSDYELIVIDDASTDHTAEVAESFGERVRLIRRRQNGQGLCAGRNDGLAAARGTYCAFLDSDDLWAPWTLECYHKAICQFGDPAIVTCDGIIGIRDEMDLTGIVQDAAFAAQSFQDYLAYRSRSAGPLLLLTGMAIRTDLLHQVGGFREKFRSYMEDQDLWLRLGAAHGFVRIERPLCWGYRDHIGNISKMFERQLEGARGLIAAEQQGEYPGGRWRQRERRKILTLWVRHVAREALGCQRISEGLDLYGKSLIWNMLLGRWRFLAAYPALAMVSLARQWARSAAPAPAMAAPQAPHR